MDAQLVTMILQFGERLARVEEKLKHVEGLDTELKEIRDLAHEIKGAIDSSDTVINLSADTNISEAGDHTTINQNIKDGN